MAVVNIFVSFEFDKDAELQNNFYKQAETTKFPYHIRDKSLHESYPTDEWKAKARKAISQCDVVIVLIGQDTHNAPGVKVETDIARSLGKPVFQVKPKKGPTTAYLILVPRYPGSGNASTKSWRSCFQTGSLAKRPANPAAGLMTIPGG